MSRAILTVAAVTVSAHATEATPVAPAYALRPQDTPTTELDPVEVVGKRLSSYARPERELGADQIDALGALNIGEVVARTGQALGLGEPPIVLINGRRVASPEAFLGFPPDALDRLEILPQGSGALYGGAPTDRVLNLVLQPHFRSQDGTFGAGRPTAEGQSFLAAALRRSTIENNDTSLAELRLSRATSLNATERDPDTLLSGGPDISLLPEISILSANLGINRQLGEWTISAGGDLRRQIETAFNATEGGVEGTRRTIDAAQINTGLTGQVSGWNLQFGLLASNSNVGQSGPIENRSDTRSLTATASADRRLLDLATGPVSTSLTGRLNWAGLASTDEIETRDGISDRIADLAASISLPLARRSQASERRGPAALGHDAALVLGASIQSSTGGPAGRGLNAALTWSPLPRMNLSGSWSETTSNPTPQQRFDPTFFGPPRTVFDLSTGKVVEIRPVLGGNPDLGQQTTEQRSFAASFGPFTPMEIAIGTSWQANEETGGIGALPSLTPAVERAFPDRFVRNSLGSLVGIDLRSINLDRSSRETLTSNLSATVPNGLNPIAAYSPDTSIQVSVAHTWALRNRVGLGPGLEASDRLLGDGGGVSRHELSAQIDGRAGRWGFNGGYRWREGYRIRRQVGEDSDGDLVLSSFDVIDLKISYAMERALGTAGEDGSRRSGVGTRLELEVANATDERPAARLGDGQPAPGYSKNDQDPVGRIVRITLNQRF